MNNSQNYSNKRIRIGNLSTRIEETVGEQTLATCAKSMFLFDVHSQPRRNLADEDSDL